MNQSSPGKLEFMDLPHGILFFQERPGILHPSPCMDIYEMEWPSDKIWYAKVIHEIDFESGIEVGNEI